MRTVRTSILLAAVALLLAGPRSVSSASKEYHHSSMNGAPWGGNWGWFHWPYPGLDEHQHVWWMKHYWNNAAIRDQIQNNKDGFEMEWFNGGQKTRCDVFHIRDVRSAVSDSAAVTALPPHDECGNPAGREQIELRIRDRSRIPVADESHPNVGISWAVVARAGSVPLVCPAPPPGQASCPYPETAEVNLEWKRGNLWLGKINLELCDDPGVRYRSAGSDPGGLAAPTNC